MVWSDNDMVGLTLTLYVIFYILDGQKKEEMPMFDHQKCIHIQKKQTGNGSTVYRHQCYR